MLIVKEYKQILRSKIYGARVFLSSRIFRNHKIDDFPLVGPGCKELLLRM
ncbi:MAG: hypothetical protein JRE58_12130 [Deltaproteobacteria bacterium]|nr:hypothetical protein [Deltaproteobacteria bacterium]